MAIFSGSTRDLLQIRVLQRLIDQTDSIIFYGGAGVSTESGLPDFRGENGLYKEAATWPPEMILSRSFFFDQTEDFFAYYKKKLIHLQARPNPAHDKLAELEKCGKLKAVITQNIDGLHQAAGSIHVLELHGSVHRNYCLACHRVFSAAYIRDCSGIPRCSCGGLIKPDVVLYEEPLDHAVLQMAARLIRRCDLLIIGGTSLAVYPAASLVEEYLGRKLVMINRAPSPLDDRACLVMRCPIGQALERIRVRL